MSSRGARAPGKFPTYTRGEIAADQVVHGAGLLVAIAATTWLFVTLGPGVSARQSVTLGVYCFGLLGMLGASAAYSIAPPGPLKARLRQVDRGMIFVMIAGSYTPFALNALKPEIGLPLCATVWGVAVLGIGLKLGRIECRERTWLALYLAMGWLLLLVLPSLVATLSVAVLTLLLTGGAVYTLGSLIHARASMRFHNVLWHAMVLIAAGLHFAAVVSVPRGSVG
jgi:hemolysin III